MLSEQLLTPSHTSELGIQSPPRFHADPSPYDGTSGVGTRGNVLLIFLEITCILQATILLPFVRKMCKSLLVFVEVKTCKSLLVFVEVKRCKSLLVFVAVKTRLKVKSEEFRW